MMTPFMIYLLVGALWALICKLTGQIDKQLEEQGINSLAWQLGITIVIIIFWAPVILYGFFGDKAE